jgi:hypothetical protein
MLIKNTEVKKTGSMAQVVECFSSKQDALNSKPRTHTHTQIGNCLSADLNPC